MFLNLRLGSKILPLLLIMIFTGSCKNIYEEMSDKETVEATLYQARRFLSDGHWSEAIAEFEKLPLATLAEESVAVEYASAFSGRCGLDFLNIAKALDEIGSTRPFNMLLNLIRASSTSNFNDCKQAEDILKTLDDGTGVLASERGKYLMAFNSLAKIAVILNYYADTNKNGTVDAGWDPCDANGATDLPAADVNEIGTGLTLFLNNIGSIPNVNNVFADLQAVCASLPAAVNFCAIVDVSGLDSFHRQGIRGVIRETTDGIGLGIINAGVAGSVCEP